MGANNKSLKTRKKKKAKTQCYRKNKKRKGEIVYKEIKRKRHSENGWRMCGGCIKSVI